MQLSIIGQAAFGEAAFRRLRAEHDVVAVSAPAPRDGARPDPLWAAATESGLAVVATAALKEPEALASWKAAGAELCVMAFVTDILPPEVLTAAARGTIQYHPSLLPLHRGSSAMNWPIIFGKSETGLSVFWPDAGIDTGPILLQRRCDIGPDATMGSLYFDQLFPMGVDALSDSVAQVAAGKAPSIAQRHDLSTYEPPCRETHGRIPWYVPGRAVYDLIRGCNPQPGAWTTYDGQTLKLFDCRFAPEGEPGMPGRVLRTTDAGFDVRLNGGVLRVLRVQAAGGRKVSAAEWAASVDLKPGSRFR
ncbi:MAG: methionyl-tRNA formyltransferase [Dehalococcoidia bacterium]